MCVASEVTAVTARAQTAKEWQGRGEVGDAACNVEEVETANEQQLHEILAELTNTTYFRLFPVDLSRKCKFWNKQKVRDEPDGRRAIACRD